MLQLLLYGFPLCPFLICQSRSIIGANMFRGSGGYLAFAFLERPSYLAGDLFLHHCVTLQCIQNLVSGGV